MGVLISTVCDRRAKKLKKLAQMQKMWALRKLILDAHILSLQKKSKRTIITRAEQSYGRVPSRDSAVCSFPYMFPVPDCRVPGHQLLQLLMGWGFAQIGQHTQHQQ